MTNKYFQILDVYYNLNEEIYPFFNNNKTRYKIEKRLKRELPFLDRITCDETNNPVFVICNGEMVATVIYNKQGYVFNRLDLIFSPYIDKYIDVVYLRYKKIQKIRCE